MQIASFDHVTEMLDEMDGWLSSLGIRLRPDRWHEAARLVRKARDQRERIERGGSRVAIPNYLHGLFEVMGMYEVMRAFHTNHSGALKAKLARALDGAVAPSDEKSRNSAARDMMFELELAAALKNGGADIELGEPDIQMRLLGQLFLMECKRPFVENSVLRNVEDAASQLGKDLDKPGHEMAYGVVAISLSRVLLEGNLVCFVPAGEGLRVVNEALAETIHSHWVEWRVKSFRKFHPRIVAVMFHLAVPWDVHGERLIHISTSNCVETGNSPEGLRILADNFPKIYQTFS
jgi:hypothetical protein